MELKINMTYEACDALFVDILLEGYNNCYWCYKEDLRMFYKDPVKNGYKKEDIDHNDKVLAAYETLAKHYSTDQEAIEKRLQTVRDKIDYSYYIINGMSRK